jgi:hypothetical protein
VDGGGGPVAKSVTLEVYKKKRSGFLWRPAIEAAFQAECKVLAPTAAAAPALQRNG